MMSEPGAVIAAAILSSVLSGLLTGFINVSIVSRSRGKFEGEVNARLNGQAERIEGLETSRGEMWGEINGHGERLAYIEGKTNGKAARV